MIRTTSDARKLARALAAKSWIEWAAAAYGPYPVVAYAFADTPKRLARRVEGLRTDSHVLELDARVCKPIPGDEALQPFTIAKPEVAVLLIAVDYRVKKERILTQNLRMIPQVRLARAMWGPTDIIAVVEEADHEAMRNLICDRIKILPGVQSNTTLYCYPAG